MKCACKLPPPLRRWNLPKKALGGSDPSGVGVSGVTSFEVFGLHPLLRVAIEVFHQPHPNGFTPTQSSWIGAALVQDGGGEYRSLGASLRESLPSSLEISSGVDAFHFDTTIDINNSGDGTWWVQVYAEPADDIDADTALALYSALRLQVRPFLKLLGT